MPEEEIEKTDESAETPDEQPKASSRRGFVTRRRLAFAAGILAVLVILLGVVALVLYRTGVGDSYVKNQFVTKMDEIGVVFDADVFRLSSAGHQRANRRRHQKLLHVQTSLDFRFLRSLVPSPPNMK
jgi:hypothetical protein